MKPPDSAEPPTHTTERSAPGDLEGVRRFLRLLWQPGDVREVRIPKHNEWGHTASGYFDSPEKLAQAVLPFDGKASIYVTLNPTGRDLLGRANNRIVTKATHATADQDILRRRFLPIDIDPVRPAGISSTEEELQAALALLDRVTFSLMEESWPEPITAISGNGCYALYPIDLPNDPEALSLIQGVLSALDTRFSTEEVKIDTTLANAARIIAVIGTMKVKGDETEDRPHRRSRILSAPEELQMVSEEKLRAFAASAAKTTSASPARSPRQTSSESLADLLDRHAIEYRKQPPDARGFVWYHLRRCPFHTDGKDYECGVGQQLPDGPFAGHCFHPEGQDKGWQEWKRALGLEFRSNGHHGVMVMEADKSSSSSAFHLTDLGNGERLAAASGDVLRWEQASRGWHFFDGQRWVPDITLRVEALAARRAREIYAEASYAETEDKRRAIADHAKRSERRERQRAMVESAKHMLAVNPQDWDPDPWLLNCLNGTLDLRDGTLRPHRREDLITKLAPVDYDPEAQARMFLSFLERVQPDLDIQAFLQRAAGYALTGVIREQHFLFLFGLGANGKSTLTNLLLHILGDYAKQAPADLLIKDKSRHPTELAFLHGARLVVATEAQESSRLDESRVKQLTGGDQITARFMRGDFFTFDPTHKLFLHANHKPRISGTDHAIWRRPLLVDFPVRVPKAEQDPELLEKLLTEAPGILRWCVQGCLAWQRQGLDPPKQVLAATETYRLEMDVIGNFLEEHCLADPDASVTAGDLYGAYSAWCVANGEEMLDSRTFGRRLSERGFGTRRGTNGTRLRLGLRLL